MLGAMRRRRRNNPAAWSRVAPRGLPRQVDNDAQRGRGDGGPGLVSGLAVSLDVPEGVLGVTRLRVQPGGPAPVQAEVRPGRSGGALRGGSLRRPRPSGLSSSAGRSPSRSPLECVWSMAVPGLRWLARGCCRSSRSWKVQQPVSGPVRGVFTSGGGRRRGTSRRLAGSRRPPVRRAGRLVFRSNGGRRCLTADGGRRGGHRRLPGPVQVGQDAHARRRAAQQSGYASRRSSMVPVSGLGSSRSTLPPSLFQVRGSQRGRLVVSLP